MITFLAGMKRPLGIPKDDACSEGLKKVGTGTNDVIDRCVELGLRKPELTFVFLLRTSVKRASSMTLGLASV